MLKFDFTLQPGFDFMEAFSRTFGLQPVGNHLQFPADLGEGWIRTVAFSEGFRFTVHRYRLHEPLRLRRRVAPGGHSHVVSFIFYASTAVPEARLHSSKEEYRRRAPSGIEVVSGDLNAEVLFPAGEEVFYGVAALSTDALLHLLRENPRSEVLQTVVDADASFLYHEEMMPEAERLLQHLAEIDDHELLGNFYFRIKVEELMYLVLHRLSKREAAGRREVGNADLEKLFRLRAHLLDDLSTPPRLPALAHAYQFSETRMKALFKQVFGDTIYNYFQRARMQEAAARLREPGVSVSDVGYALGFSNLSHFSRLFRRYYDLTPKRYAAVG